MEDVSNSNMESRVFRLEQAWADIKERLGAAEDKLKSAWKYLSENNQRMERLEKRMDNLEQKIDGLEKDSKETKVILSKINKVLKTLVIIVCFIGVISIGFFVYIWRHDAELARAILTLGTTIGKIVA